MKKVQWDVRQLIIGVILGVIVLGLNITSVMAQGQPNGSKTYKVMIDQNIEVNKGFNLNTVMMENRTLVPANKMYQALGYKVKWDETIQTMTAIKGNITITFKVGQGHGIKNYKNTNYKTIYMDVPVQYINNEVYVTLGFVSKSTDIVLSKKNNNIYAYDQTVAYYQNNAAERAVVKISTAGSYAQNRYNMAKRIVCSITDPDMTDLEKVYEIIDYLYQNSEYGMVNFHGGNPGYNEKTFDSNISVMTHGVGDQESFAQTAQSLFSAADIKNNTTGIPGAFWRWNIVQIDGQNYHLNIGRTVESKYDSYNPFDKGLSYYNLFTQDSDKKKENRFGRTPYENYTPLKATSSKMIEISNIWYGARDGRWIYFNRFDDQPGFYKINIDGTGMTLIHEETPFDLKIQGDWIYYRLFNPGIIEEKFYKIRKDGSEKTELPIDSKAKKYIVTPDGIYYSLDKIYKTDLNGQNQRIISQYPASRMRLDGNWIYYTNSKDQDKLYKVNIIDGTNKCIINQAGIDAFTTGIDYVTYRIPKQMNGIYYWYNTSIK